MCDFFFPFLQKSSATRVQKNNRQRQKEWSKNKKFAEIGEQKNKEGSVVTGVVKKVNS